MTVVTTISNQRTAQFDAKTILYSSQAPYSPFIHYLFPHPKNPLPTMTTTPHSSIQTPNPIARQSTRQRPTFPNQLPTPTKPISLKSRRPPENALNPRSVGIPGQGYREKCTANPRYIIACKGNSVSCVSHPLFILMKKWKGSAMRSEEGGVAFLYPAVPLLERRELDSIALRS